MQVRLNKPNAISKRVATPLVVRGIFLLLAAACVLYPLVATAATRHAKAAAHAKPAKKAKAPKALRVKSTVPAAPPPAAAAAKPAPALSLPAAATPVAAVALPRAATPAVALPHAVTPVAAAAKPVGVRPDAKGGKLAKAVPAAKPAAVGLAAASTPSAAPAAPAAARAQPLPSAVSPTAAAAPAKPRANAGPVATAWALPQVPPEKLKSDVKHGSIVRLIQASKFSEALAEVDALLVKSPDDDELLVQRARLLFWLDRREASRTVLAPVQVRHPEDAEIRELDAQLLLSDGDKSGALAQYRALELAGDGRPELHQRIIDLALELEETPTVSQELKAGGQLNDEQDMLYARLVHPWFSDVAGTTTLHSGSTWWRADAHIGRRLSKRFSFLLGGIYERRAFGTETEWAAAAKGEFYFGFSRLDGMIHFEGSPNKTILPAYDGRADLALSIVKEFSLGLYGRLAHYATSATSQTFPTTAWTLAPNVIFYVKDWTLQPGYMLMHLAPSATTATTYYHTGFFKARWEPHPRWMAFAWLYLGTDPTFVERFGINTPVGTSLVLGGEHWWTARWGTRLSVSRIQPFDAKNDPFTDITVVLRGRL